MSRAEPAARAATLLRFEVVQRQTECVFAKGARLWGSEDWEPGRFAASLDRFAQRLAHFVAVADAEALDGIVLEIAEPGAGSTVASLAVTTSAVVEHLAAVDRSPPASRPIDDPEWWFTFGGMPLFIATFAPCYGPDSSRFAFGLQDAYLLFQTRGSFVRRHQPGGCALPESARRRTRAAFERAGRPYDLSITLSSLEAHRFVKPGRLGDPPVAWWRDLDRTAQEHVRDDG